MLLIVAIIILTALRYFEIGPVADLSWWWIVGLMVAAFVWFEFIERMLGLDKKKAHESLQKARQERVKKSFDKK
jgi:small Trp-rich protein